ncbi:MAG: KpsF/GutQ family sugar-phosphate isomerase [Pseudomonadota bacterium]
MTDAFLTAGREVLNLEAEGLSALKASLDDSFSQAVARILQTEGRVIVSGMGKSGHIGAKIAATFASTGTPAQFVHPGEASHGDLGMITPKDLVLLMSNSGETAELADIIAYTRGRDIPLIGIAGRRDSTLIYKADIGLVLPRAREACPNGLAPTTSAIMTLALGDALAVALMGARGFTPEHYHDLHPGGQLGARLARVEELMHTGDAVPLLPLATGMDEVLLTISSKSLGVTGLVDPSGKLAGIITDGDLRRNMAGLLDRKAADVMTANPQTIGARARASEALDEMQTRRITCLFVCDDEGRPEGLLHIHDCLRAGLR